MRMELSQKQGPFGKYVFTRRDAILFLCALAAAGICFLWFMPSRTAGTAVVEQNGTELYRIDLNAVAEPYEITINGEYPAVLLVEHNAISFKQADCPDKLCVRTGKISRTGQAAVCLPAKITVRIVGTEKSFDGITG